MGRTCPGVLPGRAATIGRATAPSPSASACCTPHRAGVARITPRAVTPTATRTEPMTDHTAPPQHTPGKWTVQPIEIARHGYDWRTFAIRSPANVCLAVVGEVDRYE